jgi:hypothetical protein
MKAALAALLALAALEASAFSIEEAYASIPHRRTPFHAASAKASPAHAAQLQRLFTLTDQGVVLRVQGMQAHRNRDRAELARVLAGYEALATTLRTEKFAPELVPARDLIVEAIAGQRRHLASRPEGGLAFAHQQLTSAPEVKNSSRQLHGAYAILMKAFPQQSNHNRTAFFDHLCALDFL